MILDFINIKFKVIKKHEVIRSDETSVLFGSSSGYRFIGVFV